jgi:Histidine kinase-, DNA gyrase B-, and HSP90-like ATPase
LIAETAATVTKREPALQRETFRTSRLLDFASEKELVAQTGHRREVWPLVILKELVDNAIDACEEAGVAPEIAITIDKTGIAVADNGPGIPADTVKHVLDFTVRVSSREAYVSPTRGAQGNALKTIVAMPFVVDGERGEVEIEARGIRHRIVMSVDRVRQEPVICHEQGESERSVGTVVRVPWRNLAKTDFDDVDEDEFEDEDAENSPRGQFRTRGRDFYKSPRITRGSTRTSRSRFAGSASGPRSRRPTRRGASGSRRSRSRPIGIRPRTSSG